MMLAWTGEQSLMCSGCGQPRDESMSPELPDGSHTDYHAEPIRCRACRAREVEAAAFSGSDDLDPSWGLYWSVSKDKA
jgi:hypothetical protein